MTSGDQMDLKKTWLIGALFDTTSKQHAGALYEFLHLFFWSTMPFWLGGIVLYATRAQPAASPWFLVAQTFQNGELLVFAISALSPVLYLALHEPDGARLFPHRLPISTIVFGVVIVCAVLFSLQRAGVTLNASWVYDFSLFLTVLALAVRYLAIVYHRYRSPSVTESDLRAPQDNFLEAFTQHRKEVK